MAERHYTDEEVAAIFERASKVAQTGPTLPAQSKGVTLAALQDIGREVGFSPESIALAAQSLDHAGHPAQQQLLGFPVGVGRTVEFDRPISDEEWEYLVADLRTTFQARGVVRYDGPFRQWTNGNLQALVEPTPTGHRLRIQSMKQDARVFISADTSSRPWLPPLSCRRGLREPRQYRSRMGIDAPRADGYRYFHRRGIASNGLGAPPQSPVRGDHRTADSRRKRCRFLKS